MLYLEFVHLSGVWSRFGETHDVEFAESVQVQLTDETPNVRCLEHRVRWIQKLSLELRLEKEGLDFRKT